MDLLDDEQDAEPGRFEAYRAPEVLAPAGFALAVASLLGYGLLSGNIVVVLASGGSAPPSTQVQVAAGLVGAALAAIPFLMGLEAVRQLLEDDPLWVRGLARATVVVGGLVVLLRLAHALATALADGPYLGY